jgi:hypothetical protein
MQIRFDKAGCIWSIILSIILTILLNLLLRACVSGGPGYQRTSQVITELAASGIGLDTNQIEHPVSHQA